VKGVAVVVVEQRLAEPVAPQGAHALLERCALSFPGIGARHVLSYLSVDGRRLICLFEAPDRGRLEALLAEIGVPFERLWEARWIPSPEPAAPFEGAGATVVVERVAAAPLDEAALAGLEARARWCLDLHRVRHLGSYLALDGRAMLCVYAAPDAEAVRRVGREAGITSGRAWAAACIGAEPGPLG
jgi:hypothetical protein